MWLINNEKLTTQYNQKKQDMRDQGLFICSSVCLFFLIISVHICSLYACATFLCLNFNGLFIYEVDTLYDFLTSPFGSLSPKSPRILLGLSIFLSKL